MRLFSRHNRLRRWLRVLLCGFRNQCLKLLDGAIQRQALGLLLFEELSGPFNVFVYGFGLRLAFGELGLEVFSGDSHENL
jgi:hypothetical protein